MIDAPQDISTVDELRAYIHRTLCAKENLLADQFNLLETELIRRGRSCGLQFLLKGPRNVRLGAVWAAEHNVVYFYDACGQRYMKSRLRQRIHGETSPVPDAA